MPLSLTVILYPCNNSSCIALQQWSYCLVVLLWLYLGYLSDYLCLCLLLFWCLTWLLKTKVPIFGGELLQWARLLSGSEMVMLVGWWDDCKMNTRHFTVTTIDAEVRSLTDWFDYLDILIKDSVGTNWMLSGKEHFRCCYFQCCIHYSTPPQWSQWTSS